MGTEAFIVVNGSYVSEVQANEPMQLYANSFAFGGGDSTTFEIDDSDGNVILTQKVGTNFMGNAWLDTVAPMVNGDYFFYPAAVFDRGNFRRFTVVGGQEPETPPGEEPKTTKNSLPLILGGGAVLLIGALLIGKAKK